MLRIDFKEVILSMAFSLQAGYVLEETITLAKDDLERLHEGEECPMCKELEWMKNSMALGQSVEELFFELARRSGLSEISSFAQVLTVSKRQGGNLVRISKVAAEHISRSIQVEQEISLLLSGKKLEKEIMLMMPYVILIYLQLTNGSYLEPLFSTWMGRFLMGGCLLVIMGARVWAERIIHITV